MKKQVLVTQQNNPPRIKDKRIKKENMKKIYVTVAEFLDNGGVLEVGRDIYVNDIGYAKVGYFTKLDGNKGMFYYDSIMGGEDTHRETHRRYVQIDATPIYK